jgi:choline/ethanolamine kinase
MAPVTQARWSALPPRLRLPAPAAADGVAATSFSRNCNVTELVVSYLSPCSSIVLFVFDGVAYEWIRIQI